MNHYESQSRAGVGISSVLMVLVVLAMTALSMLAFSSARTTESMTGRNAEVSQGYYQAAAKVQRRLQQIDLAAFHATKPYTLEWGERLEIPNVEWVEKEDGLYFTIFIQGDDLPSIVAEGIMRQDGSARYQLLSHKQLSEAPPEDQNQFLNLMGE